MDPMTPGQFMARAPQLVGSNTVWGANYARDLQHIVCTYAANAPRSKQRHLGPSELAVECDRQVAGKMAELPRTNHVSDPWPSIMGTAGHKWMEGAFNADNARIVAQLGRMRWLIEFKVVPMDEHPGSGDLYDGYEYAVVDHKFFGKTSLAKIKTEGPSRRYKGQLLLYGKGYARLGLPVTRVVIVAWPRTSSTITDMYVWDHPLTEADDQLIEEVELQTKVRRVFAEGLRTGRLTLNDIPATPDDHECFYCPLYSPEVAHGNTERIGCAGTIGHRPG